MMQWKSYCRLSNWCGKWSLYTTKSLV